MGSRGASSGRGGSGGGIMKDFKRIKGEHTSEQDLAAVNPNFVTRKKEWTYNCQRCVAAYEARRRGYDVEALPYILNGTDTLPHMTDTGFPSLFNATAKDFISASSRSGEGSMKIIQKKMSAFGDGARAVVCVRWQKGSYGHVFIAEQRNGKTHFIDPQSNSKDVSYYFGKGMIRSTKTSILRIDNREFGDNIKLSFKNRK